jgi:hypothetical protein
MSSFCSELELQKAANGDIKTLSDLDQRGLLIGAFETPNQYVERLKVFQKNLNNMENDLKEKKSFTVEDLTFPEQERIPQTSFNQAGKITSDLYDFKIDWVPGFFITPDFGMLFGGCAYSFDPDFFSLFIIRNSFKKKKKWLVYERDELMSHELCHVARFAMKAHTYEELFAYQTSTSAFRRGYGSMMRAAWETYILMGLLLIMLVTQVYLVIFHGEWMAERSILNNPINGFYLLIGLFTSFLVSRQKIQNINLKALFKNFEKITDKPRALAFRLSDNELDILVKQKELTKEKFQQILRDMKSTDIRIELISKRFLK